MIKDRGTRGLLLTIILLLMGVDRAAAGNEVTWFEAVAPPFFIHEGELAGQGYEDVVTDIIIEKLPEYQHKHVVANISRHYKQFKKGMQACNVGLFKTEERQEFLYYSLPSFFTLPAVLIIRKEKYEEFGSEKSVRLEDVLRKNLVIARSKNRSYGRNVDIILDTHGTGNNIFLHEGQELSLSFFKMLRMGRLDGLIGLPEEAMYHAERLGIRDEIMTLTIEENQEDPESWLSYVACSKTPWGKQFINAVNTILIQQRPTKRYRGAYERWLDNSSVDEYRRLYDDVFLKVVK